MESDQEKYFCGIDIGSTTCKIVVLDEEKTLLFESYKRHNASVRETLTAELEKAEEKLGNPLLEISITGSAGLGIAEVLEMPFVQETIAVSSYITHLHPEVHSLVDIGGEDSKLIFFKDSGVPDIRMNGNCAGGTGAFIDQMSQLLNIELSEMDAMVENATRVYPIASRCGVFAKTDVQNLLGKKIPKEDIILSIFHAVAVQTINTLFRGESIKSKLMLCGGPFSFFKALRKVFCKAISVSDEKMLFPENSLLLTAIGAALFKHASPKQVLLSELSQATAKIGLNTERQATLKRLFNGIADFNEWKTDKSEVKTGKATLGNLDAENVFLGIDAGSTTTKMVLLDNNNRIAFRYYRKNQGDILETVKDGLRKLLNETKQKEIKVNLTNIFVTGYGEDLVRTSLGISNGVVETLAHTEAAKYFEKDVSFILDIGGQDMKAIFIENGLVKDMQINESCSSGCGSFIETFAGTLGYEVGDFAQKACVSQKPYDLGSRCTVFMNSKVKQCLRESVNVEDISAGLAYSVIKNCFQKVLKINDFDVLGEHILVQGGTFKNDAVYRAMQKYTGKEVLRPDICELMGAFGCALIAKKQKISSAKPLHNLNSMLEGIDVIKKSSFICKGCSNSCQILKTEFANGNHFYTGNRCEKFSVHAQKNEDAHNFYAFKYNEIFSLPSVNPDQLEKERIGIPRILNFYENFPFWKHLFMNLGFRIVLSDDSDMSLSEKGNRSIMSDNICFPAKLAHGHIEDLIDKKVDRIFFPMVRYEVRENSDAVNSYNCPIVTGYADVIKCAIDPASKGVLLDSPLITFTNKKLLRNSCLNYFKEFEITESDFYEAFEDAYKKYVEFKKDINIKANTDFNSAVAKNKPIVILAGRPYHLDPLIHHGIPEMIAELGAYVITEDIIPAQKEIGENNVLTQWQYSNRLYCLAHWAAKQDNVYFVHLNSFGCGPDAVVMDEVREILENAGKTYTLLRIDEISNLGSAKLRIRSLLEVNIQNNIYTENPRKTTPPFKKSDRKKTVLAPYFSPYYSLFINSLFAPLGYNFVTLPEPDRQSVETGLKYVNNDVCYPAVILIGDIIKALQTGKYDVNNTVAAITETGGQCRASNYVPLLKKALLKAGFETVPVVSVSASAETLNLQPGFKKRLHKMIPLALSSLLYIDSLIKLYHAVKAREVNKGDAKYLLDKYFRLGMLNMGNYSIKKSFTLLKEAVHDFNALPVNDKRNVKRVGLVGEIYMKYNPFGNFEIEKRLEENNFEIVLPPLLTFFLESLVDTPFNHKNYVERTSLLSLKIGNISKNIIDKRIDKVNAILETFRFEVLPLPKINDLAEHAEKLVSLINQFGEGWLLPGEMVMMAEEGIRDILCVQPFGCIANHVIAKGVGKKFQKLYPESNVLLLDMDADSSPVNLQNRLELFVYQTKIKKGIHPITCDKID